MYVQPIWDNTAIENLAQKLTNFHKFPKILF